jgi:hypothetical protein
MPFRRPVILGTELISFSAIMTCAGMGIRPVAMIEPGPRTVARWPTGLFPRLKRIPLRFHRAIVRIEGGTQVTGVVLDNGERIACDGVILTGAFRPDAAVLIDSHIATDPASGGPAIDGFGRCSDPAYFAAGNLLRAVETAGWCWAEGRAVAADMVRALHGALPAAPGPRLVAGSGVSWCLPHLGTNDRLDLRLSAPARGRILLRDGARIIAAHAVDSRPERRISLPLPRLGPEVDEVSVTLERAET